MKHAADKYNYKGEGPLAILMTLVFLLSIFSGNKPEATAFPILTPKEVKKKRELSPEDSTLVYGEMKKCKWWTGYKLSRNQEDMILDQLKPSY